MIPAAPGWVARYQPDNAPAEWLTVIAWSASTQPSAGGHLLLDDTRVRTVADIIAEDGGKIESITFAPDLLPTEAV